MGHPRRAGALRNCTDDRSLCILNLILTGNPMSLSEADTRAKLIDPALHVRGWTEDLIRREGLTQPH